MKYLVVVLLTGILIVLAFMAYMQFGNKNTPAPIQTTLPLATNQSAIATPDTTTSQEGSVTIKLCYPAEMIPQGTIEAKNIQNKQVSVEQYLGSEVDKTNTVQMSLPEGDYIFRFKINEEMAGYYTKTCPTGSETTCAQTNQRENIEVAIKPGKSAYVSLCDFYYSPETKPTF